MPPAKLDIIYQDNHLLAVNKPAGLPTMGVAPTAPSLVMLARQYIKRTYRKPGGVYLGIMSRLDAGTSGIVLLARTSKAARRLTDQFRTRTVCKTYWAVVSGAVDPPEGELTDWLVKDESQQRMVVARAGHPAAKEARLRYRVLRRVGPGTLVEIELLTGRKHQIRVQFAERGHPVWGDAKYGSQHGFAAGLALHARRLVVDHPVRHEPMTLVAPLPASWLAAGVTDGAG
ncbi:MAG: RluA family pseudouridine synthase [Pirellulales bacterium]